MTKKALKLIPIMCILNMKVENAKRKTQNAKRKTQNAKQKQKDNLKMIIYVFMPIRLLFFTVPTPVDIDLGL